MNMMYGFILNMWIMKRIGETELDVLIGNKTINQDEKEMIMATPQTNIY